MARIEDYGQLHYDELRHAIRGRNDVARINQLIRQRMAGAAHQEELSEWVRRSHHVCGLAHGPLQRQKFGRHLDDVARESVVQNQRTVDLANLIVRQHGWAYTYDPWVGTV